MAIDINDIKLQGLSFNELMEMTLSANSSGILCVVGTPLDRDDISSLSNIYYNKERITKHLDLINKITRNIYESFIEYEMQCAISGAMRWSESQEYDVRLITQFDII